MYCALGGANKTNLLNIKHFFNTSSYFASRFTKSSRTIVNISLIASLALSQSLAAVTLPSGGKFVNGTGSIAINGNTMEITGKDTNHVIAWGGGFNIGKGYTVDFTTENLNYLNLDYTNKASQILGTLNGRTNNVYIVNPSGVLIGEGATINANKFGVSTTPFRDDAKETFLSKGSFSAAFDANKGDVVNMGTINANEIVLVGNKVENIKGTLQSKNQGFANQVTIEGNKVYLEGSRIKAAKLDAKIESEGFYRYEAKELEDAVKLNGGLLNRYNFTTKGDFKKYLYIGKESATNDQMIDSWTGFTKLFNDKKLQGWGFNDIYLGNNIDFKNKLIDSVGEFATLFDPSNKPFSGNFYGNGYTLSNLLINAEGKKSAGLFAYINGGSVQDLTINGLNFQGSASYMGGLAGYINNVDMSTGIIKNGTFSNIALRNIGDISSSDNHAGGFAGYIGYATLSNIALENIGNISSDNHAGGFAGQIESSTLSNIALKNIGNISGSNAGGFAGYIEKGDFSNIVLNSMYIKAYNRGPTKYTGVFLGIGSTYTAEKIYSYGVLGSSLNQTGIEHPNSTALDLTQLNDLQKLQDNSGISGLEYHEMQDEDGIPYLYLHMVTNGNVGGEDSEITFDEENFTYNTPDIPEINPDGSGTSSLPEVSNEGELSDVVVGSGDFNEEILNSILGEHRLEFDLLSGDLESIRQSLDFLTAFLKDENTVSDDFDYIPNDNYDSDVHVKFKDNLQVFIENAIQDKDLDLDFLKDYRASLEKYNNDKKLYESGLLHPELQASLEKDLEKQYAELLGSKDKVDSMLGIFGDYKLILDKDKTIFTDNEKSKLKFKVGIGELVNYKNTEGGGENNNNFNPPSDLFKQTELSSKEPILVLPAEETQNVIDEGERELGRVCIVSDNAKTSNPCIAIAF